MVAGLTPLAMSGAAVAAPAPTTASAGLPIAVGRAPGGDGLPVAGRVSLLIDPGAQPVGTEVTLPVVASATTGADGRYQLALAPTIRRWPRPWRATTAGST